MVSAFPNPVEAAPIEVPTKTLPVEAAREQPVQFLAEVPPIESMDLAGLNVQQLAAEGYFQAIAYWLNEPLIPQNVYAQVRADALPGCIKVLVEFERAPQPERLLKFVCDRIYKLNSNIIQGVYLIARIVGTGKTDWSQRVRIPTLSQRQQKQGKQPSDSPLDSSLDSSSDKQSQPNPPQLMHETSRSTVARAVVRSQFKFFRAALMSGTATAAFLFGGLTELVLSERLSAPETNEPTLTTAPWYDNGNGDGAEVVFRSGHQFSGRTVEAALETVAVIPHNESALPDDPTITLLFGGELGLSDFVFEDAESLDHLFSDLTIYQQADIAMVGLSEPLATASTSLQENFYHRTRPQAVQALRAGGIDIVNLASEGTLARGARGLEETLRTLDQQGIYRVGAGRNEQEAHRPEILEVKGQRIAYLGYNPEAVQAARDDKAGVALTNSKERSHIAEDIRAIRPQVDWIVVNYRWGDILGEDTEKAAEASDLAAIPENWQQSLAHEAIDAGADLVVGYHPSQIQGAEIYRDRAIAYSLGDFVFGEAPLEDHDTAALRVSLRNQQMRVEFLPVSIRDSQIQMATGEQGTAILQSIRNASRTFEQPLRFPTVLDAPILHTPAPPAGSVFSPEDFTRDPDYPSSNEPSANEPSANEPSANEPSINPAPIEAFPAVPLPTDSLPDEQPDEQPDSLPDSLLDEQPDERLLEETEYNPPAPHPSLREPEALFPTEETTPSGNRSTEDPFIDTVPSGVREEIRSSPLDLNPDSGDSQSIETYEEPLIGPLSALPGRIEGSLSNQH